jgi:hypothetical protein
LTALAAEKYNGCQPAAAGVSAEILNLAAALAHLWLACNMKIMCVAGWLKANQ